MSNRDALAAYLADMAAGLQTARPLHLLADVVLTMPEDDERLQTLASLAIRNGRFTPGAATEHAIRGFAGTTREACQAFLNTLVQIAKDDALARARSHGFLPPRRPP